MQFYDHCCKILVIKKFIIYGKEALLLSDLFEDIERLCEKNGIEESIITITRTLKRKITDTFSEEISIYPNGKYLIVQSNDVNTCHYLIAVLKDKGLKVTSDGKLFFAIN